MNKEIELLHNKLEAQDKIINTQALEIARLNKDLKDACYVIEKIKKEKQQAIKYIKEHQEKQFAFNFEYALRDNEIDILLELLGDKE